MRALSCCWSARRRESSEDAYRIEDGARGVKTPATGGSHPLAQDVCQQCVSSGGRVRCSNRGIDDASTSSVAEGILAAKTGLTSLCLSGNTIGASGAKALKEALRSSSHLAELDMSANSLGAEGATHLADALECALFLETLDLSQNNIGDAGAKALSTPMRTGWFKLRCLSLASNGLTDVGTEAVSEGLIAATPSIEEVYLQDNSISDHGATALAQTLRFCSSLRVLDLNGNRIKDHGARQVAQALHNSKKLELLKIRGVKLGWQGREAISQLMTALPKCKVLYDSDRGQPADYSAINGESKEDLLRRMSVERQSEGTTLPGQDSSRRRHSGWDSKAPAAAAPPVMVLAPHLRNLGGCGEGAAPSGRSSGAQDEGRTKTADCGDVPLLGMDDETRVLQVTSTGTFNGGGGRAERNAADAHASSAHGAYASAAGLTTSPSSALASGADAVAGDRDGLLAPPLESKDSVMALDRVLRSDHSRVGVGVVGGGVEGAGDGPSPRWTMEGGEGNGEDEKAPSNAEGADQGGVAGEEKGGVMGGKEQKGEKDGEAEI